MNSAQSPRYSQVAMWNGNRVPAFFILHDSLAQNGAPSCLVAGHWPLAPECKKFPLVGQHPLITKIKPTFVLSGVLVQVEHLLGTCCQRPNQNSQHAVQCAQTLAPTLAYLALEHDESKLSEIHVPQERKVAGVETISHLRPARCTVRIQSNRQSRCNPMPLCNLMFGEYGQVDVLRIVARPRMKHKLIHDVGSPWFMVYILGPGPSVIGFLLWWMALARTLTPRAAATTRCIGLYFATWPTIPDWSHACLQSARVSSGKAFS
jgi:hypothetical protein